MLIAHLADLHLGYRAYARLAPGGINARERDVALAFRAALDRIIELRADLVLVAGDVFHTVRPSNAAITDAFRQFARLRAALPDAPVVLIAGNHDTPRAAETGGILRLFAEIPGVVVVDDAARAVYLEQIGVSVLCVPHAALASGDPLALDPDPAAAVNVLMLHGDVVGGGAEARLRYVSEYGGARIEAAAIRPERWDYVALGHYHIATELAPNMWYAGGIERTSTNIWEEAHGEKGFLTYDTETRRVTLHPVPTRPVVDLPRFSARADAIPGPSPRPLHPGGGEEGGSAGDGARGEQASAAASGGAVGPRWLPPEQIDAHIRRLVEAVPGGIAGKIVRLVIEDVPRELFRQLDHRQIRAYKAEALHFHLDVRRPEVRRVVGYGAPFRRRTLEEEVENFLQRHWQPSSREIDIARLIELAKTYLAAEAGAEPRDPLVAARMEG
ncbi:MAG TPA: DNA repair exonuclease [Longimicrobiales bacterium]